MHEHHGRRHHHEHEPASVETLRKLLAMLEHWIDHGDSHVESYREWAERASAAGEEEIAREVRLAIEASNSARDHLKRAKAVLAAKLVLKK